LFTYRSNKEKPLTPIAIPRNVARPFVSNFKKKDMILLKPLAKSNVSSFFKWINDDDVIKYSLSLFDKINTEKEIENWFYGLLRDKVNISLGIFLETTGELIGYAGICDISKTNKSGEYFIFIGEKKLWGKGIGKEVTEKILNIGFTNYGLNRIMLTVLQPNIGGQKAYKRAGFKIEGLLREAAFRDNKFYDKIIMSVLSSEWDERKTTTNPTINK
jgi:RimJ/RimL family protein N-acetyltransferase